MKNLHSSEVRQMYLDFFKEKGHRVEPSASLVPKDDPSLLWINSGVATMKKYFDGRVVPENPRIVNAQKAIRTNDIENVGVTARHQTLFEMLGNFSIGDYFKEEAIVWAWEFLTSDKWIGFDPDKLAVTIYPEDDEAYKIWHERVGLPEDRIIKLEENFWDIGEGPCGPNTEIFYDRGPEYGDDPDDPELFPGGENERHLEVWNLVFSQFNHNPDGSYTPLPNKNIDTGMGLERMVSIIQDARTNFDTDLFLPVIREIEKLSGVGYNKGNQSNDTAFKVIADHLRAVTFAISDGALPSNEGRGYVLRRLLRRAVRFAMELGLDKPFMDQLVPIVVEIMDAYYTELPEKMPFIQKIIRSEEERFHETLHDGINILEGYIEEAKRENQPEISGSAVFKLYDTYGFPVELTEEYAAKEGLSIDQDGFELALEAQRERARQARDDSGSMQVQNDALRKIDVPSEFIGYEENESPSKVEVILKNNEKAGSAEAGETCQLILDRTPFYAESGGQIADGGFLENEGVTLQIVDVQKAPNGQNLHTVEVKSGMIRPGDQVLAKVDKTARTATERNHTATHLLHQSLKDVLGGHVNQAGSLVQPERLRFDFSHFGKVSADELKKIEGIVNEQIWKNIPVVTMQKSLEEAKAMGAMALFGEKYGDVVRVVEVGDYSLELCGGCHVKNTAEIGLFKIAYESGIGAGTRRIEAVTGRYAFELLTRAEEQLAEVSEMLKTPSERIAERIEGLQQQIRNLEKENQSLTSKLSNSEAGDLSKQIKEINGIKVLAASLEGRDMGTVREMIDTLKNDMSKGIIVLASVKDNKVNLASGVTKDLMDDGYHAGQLIKKVAEICGGGGGGRPDMAQAGGKDPSRVNEALAYVEEWVKDKSAANS